jgi:ABC-type transport system substrate-binding protein
LIAATLKEAGFATVISPVDASTQIFAFYTEATPETPCNLAHGNFDVAMHAFSSQVDPLGNYATYHSNQFQPTGGNDARVSIAEVDAALDAVKSTIDFAEVTKAMKTFQQIYVDQVIEIPLFYRKAVELVSPTVGNFVAHPTLSGPLWNAVDLYIK